MADVNQCWRNSHVALKVTIDPAGLGALLPLIYAGLPFNAASAHHSFCPSAKHGFDDFPWRTPPHWEYPCPSTIWQWCHWLVLLHTLGWLLVSFSSLLHPNEIPAYASHPSSFVPDTLNNNQGLLTARPLAHLFLRPWNLIGRSCKICRSWLGSLSQCLSRLWLHSLH
jgi:hypothetical protein